MRRRLVRNLERSPVTGEHHDRQAPPDPASTLRGMGSSASGHGTGRREVLSRNEMQIAAADASPSGALTDVPARPGNLHATWDLLGGGSSWVPPCHAGAPPDRAPTGWQAAVRGGPESDAASRIWAMSPGEALVKANH